MGGLIKSLNSIVWLCVVLFSMDALGADFVARLDRTQVVEGDPVVLTLAASGGANGSPDLTPLQQDFDLINRAHSTHMRIVNGRSSSGTEWHLTLMPKRTGKIEIPAIRFGSASSKPLTLEVLPASQAAKQGMPRPVMVEVDAEPKAPYVQQKVLYTVRLLFALPLRDVKLSEPHIGDALVQPLGDERRFETYRNGRQYQAVERRYAIQPQHSGKLKIGGPLLTAQIVEPGQRGGSLRDRFFGSDPFANLGGMFGQTRPIQVRGPELTIDVRPQPAGTASPWLPAESLTLNESWSPNPPEFRVGEPVTRTIAITAQGLTGEQLPELTLNAPAGVKVYPEQSRAETRPDKETLVAQKVIRAAMIPSRAGAFTLPEIQVAWWDLAAGREMVARLPSRRIEVAPAPAGSVAGSPAPGTSVAAQADVRDLMDTQPGASNTSMDQAGSGLGYWPWVAAILGLGLFAVTGLWWRERQRSMAIQPTPEPVAPAAAAKKPDPAKLLAALEQACRASDARKARSALLQWAETRWPHDPPRGLDAIAERLGRGADDILRVLDSALYADSDHSWDGQAAWQQLRPLLDAGQSKKTRESNSLPALYPETR